MAQPTCDGMITTSMISEAVNRCMIMADRLYVGYLSLSDSTEGGGMTQIHLRSAKQQNQLCTGAELI